MHATTGSRPGMPGGGFRRLASGAVLLVGVLNILLAAKRRLFLHIGPVHGYVPHLAIQSSRYMLLAAGLTMVASAWGLLHGKRQAWRLSVAALAVALIAHPLKRVDYVGIATNAALLLVLLPAAPKFPARTDPMRARQGLLWLLLGEAGVFVYGVLGLYFLDRHFADHTSFADALEDALRLLFVLPSTTIVPTTRHGSWFIDSVRVSALCVLMVGLYHLLHPVIHRATLGREERRRVESILDAYATSSLAFFHLLPDKSYFFPSVGEAFIGYRVVGHSAVALGEPIGEPAALGRVVGEFADFCDRNGWAFCFHQVTPSGREQLALAGMQSLKIGEEAIVDVRSFSLAGKSFKHMRNAINRLTQAGVRVEFIDPPISDEVVSEIEEVSDLWLQNDGHRERSFTLGAFSRDYARSSSFALARSATGRLEAFVNIIPSYRSANGNFDMMRRRPDAPDGVMDLLIVSLVERFRDCNFEGLTLGMTPLANLEGSGLVPSALRLLYARGNELFNFAGLRTYKEKWHPRWEPLYLCFRSDLQLPSLAVAVARAGERSGKLPLRVRWPKRHARE
ncbi:MAG: bifunctional lysylphosphatidylglycerol flippase/synthetase MprF [Dehalococcoidia bacterium]